MVTVIGEEEEPLGESMFRIQEEEAGDLYQYHSRSGARAPCTCAADPRTHTRALARPAPGMLGSLSGYPWWVLTMVARGRPAAGAGSLGFTRTAGGALGGAVLELGGGLAACCWSWDAGCCVVVLTAELLNLDLGSGRLGTPNAGGLRLRQLSAGDWTEVWSGTRVMGLGLSGCKLSIYTRC